MSIDDTEKILSEADSLIQRHAFATASPWPPPAPDPAITQSSHESADNDLPLLTEVVTHPVPAPPQQAHLDAIHKELARWLEEELPTAVLKVTDGVADQLMKELTYQAEKQLLPRLIAHLDNPAR
uniref:Uncharacterized protein n=1 Tax=uncultured bacterium P11N2 TaxID=1748282 RepID=A0A0U3T399_9BACT|nr:hypothetical protein [uncultured bacterium P11N2]